MQHVLRRLWLAGLLALIPAAYAKPLPAGCALNRIGSIELNVTPNRVLVPIRSGGKDAWMLLNTATAITVMSTADADAFASRTKPLFNARPVYWGDKKVTRSATSDEFFVGPVNLGQVTVLMADAAPNTVIAGKPVIGYLGLDLFQNMDFELDLAARTLALYSQDHCPNTSVYWADSYSAVPLQREPLGIYAFPLELQGQKILAIVSTGTKDAGLPTDVTRSLYQFDERSPNVEHEKDAKGHDVAAFRAMTITGQGIKIADARVQLLPSQDKCKLSRRPGGVFQHEGCFGIEAPFKLGISILEHMHLYFATRERMLYFTGDAAAPTSLPPPANGPAPPGSAH